jgi:large subunit ribosomal protein L4
MATISTFTKVGAKSTTSAKLPKEVFEIEVKNHELVKAAYVAYLANGRQNNAKVKNRGEVSGGGKKPWRQKGTGRARFGSSRVPIWRGGGITHGPTGYETYSHNMSTGDKRLALRQALTLKTEAGNVSVIESLEIKTGKTKELATLLTKVGVTRNALIVVHEKDASFDRASSNIGNIKVVRARSLNVFDVMNADTILFATKSLDEVAEWLGGKS